MAAGEQRGMLPMDGALAELVRAARITLETARAAADDPDGLARSLGEADG